MFGNYERGKIMKKSLILAMAMCVSASCYAANPFGDVPANHWAYGNISKLAAAGIIDGYGTNFGGEKLMTRYEMAQIVAKAMAKGADVEKLATEFADELNSLGVRVAKLEKKQDNVKITGQLRFTYQDDRGRGNSSSFADSRTRIFVEGSVNDNWTYTGMLEQLRQIGHHSSADEDIKLVRAYLDGRLGGVKLRVGHWNEFFLNEGILDDMIDGIQATYDGLLGGKVKIYGVASKWASDAYGWAAHDWRTWTDGKTHEVGYDDDGRLYILGASAKIGEVDTTFNYFKTTGKMGILDEDVMYDGGRNIYNINACWSFLKGFKLKYDYMWADNRFYAIQADTQKAGGKDGWVAQMIYKGADPAQAGTWGIYLYYYDQPSSVFLFPTYSLNCFDGKGGYDGWCIGGDLTLTKNIYFDVFYSDTQSKGRVDGKKERDRCICTELYFFF